MAKPLAQVEPAGLDFGKTNDSVKAHIAGIRLAGMLRIVALHGCQRCSLKRRVVTMIDHYRGGGASVTAESHLSMFADPEQGSAGFHDAEVSMGRRPKRTLGACVAAVLLAAGCASFEPYDSKLAEDGRVGVLWTRTTDRDFMEMKWKPSAFATVSRIDSTEIMHNQPSDRRPRNLTPGRHLIEVTSSYEVLLPLLIVAPLEMAHRSFELVVEPGHSYMPFVRRLCDKDWIGILDTGSPARDDIATWRSVGGFMFQYRNVRRLGPGSVVVAGDRPPENCDAR